MVEQLIDDGEMVDVECKTLADCLRPLLESCEKTEGCLCLDKEEAPMVVQFVNQIELLTYVLQKRFDYTVEVQDNLR